ncbi:T9SS type A sorting domain-containing protein [uncultured Fibrella sp.]|uniref:T9SS type A sorting domain-containing protein n=1 Tax=uncultured Fibrella sp. TaxID=1284596 RepID=UPI0035CA8C7F
MKAIYTTTTRFHTFFLLPVPNSARTSTRCTPWLMGVIWLLLVGLAFTLSTAHAQTTWTSRNAAAENQWVSATYGNGLFVAVAFNGTGNRVMTSPDGITWTSRSSAADNQWRSITYGLVNGNPLFVAVASSGAGNRVMTSPDGITWTSRSSAADNLWISVTYGLVNGNPLFVAVASSGAGNRVMTSLDGITWTSRSSAADNNWNTVTYGNGLFVAVSNSGIGDRVMTSPDGINWTIRTPAVDNAWLSVTYGNGLFVAVSITGSGNRVMTSPDGITWTSRSSAADNLWYSVTYGNGLFVAVAFSGTGSGNNQVMTSPDGINWTSRSAAANNNWESVTYGNGLFVAVAYSGTGNRVMTSPYDPAALPVTLTYFSGRATPQGNRLGWATASEHNSAAFRVERSRDLTGFEAIATLPTQAREGESGTTLTYTFTDPLPLPGINYYRLAQVDRTGSTTLSKPIALQLEGQPPVLYPNPVSTSGEAVVEPAVTYLSYQLSDVLGRVVVQQNAPGTLSGISLAGLSAGAYMLRVVTAAGGVKLFRVVR